MTTVLEFVETGALTAGMIVHGAITIATVPEKYRGRIFGIVRGMSVVLIPISALVGGWIAEFVRSDHVVFAGAYVLGVALLGVGEIRMCGGRGSRRVPRLFQVMRVRRGRLNEG